MAHNDDINAYIDGVLSGEIPAGELAKQAVLRHIADLDNQVDFYFDEALADKACRFVELMPHVKGKWSKPTIELAPWQKFILGSVFGWVDIHGNRRFKTVYIEVARKNAKALALDTLIPTPEGIKQIQDISPGDQVYGANGNPINVIAESPIFDGRKCYRLTFSDGATVVCDAQHEWLTTARIDQPNNNRKGPAKGSKLGVNVQTRVRTTEEIYRTQKSVVRGDNNHSIDVAAPVAGSYKKLPIDPYVFGVWLGDGANNTARIVTMDAEIVEECRNREGISEPQSKRGKASNYRLGHSFREGCPKSETVQARLRGLGVLNNKHIPNIYLESTIGQRMDLLAGLMDTDGACSKAGQCNYYGINERLVGDVHKLISGLGFKSTFTSKIAKLKSHDYSVECFTASFWAYKNRPVFKVRRKYKQQKPKPLKLARSSRRVITNVEKIESVPTKCLSVDSPDNLFLCTEQCIATHNSTLSSAIGLYVLSCDDEPGAECVTAATTRDQARIVFNDSKRMAELSPEFCDNFGIATSAHTVYRESTGGNLKSVSAEGKTLDGLNIHLAIIDELHAHRSRAVWDVIETSTASRSQPLMFAITTAGSNRTGICYEQRDYVKKVLAGVVDDDEYFGVIYAVDDEDMDDRDKLLSDPGIWAKANPNLGVSVRVSDLQRKARKARQQASAQNNFLTKHLNVWVNADTAWIPIQAWDKCCDPDLQIEDFAGQECVMGLDLASKRDIMAQVYTFEKTIKGQKHLYVFGDYYLPQLAVEESLNSQYEGWEIEGRLIVSPGSTNDFSLLEDRIQAAVNTYQMRTINYDPSQATQLSTRMADESIEMHEVRQSVANFSEPMKEIEAMIYDGRLHHNGCPIMSWAISNVVAHTDSKDQIYPRKEAPENKIDPVVALIMCERGWIDGVEETTENVFKTRGARSL